MDQMRLEFERMGIGYAGVLDRMVNSTGGELAMIEAMVTGSINGLTAFFNGNTALAASAARWAGNAAAAATSAWNSHFSPSASVPGISSFERRDPDAHDGGIVPGSPGQTVRMLLKAGETVLPTHLPGQSKTGSGGNVTVNVEGFIGSEEELIDAVTRGMLRADARGSAGISV